MNPQRALLLALILSASALTSCRGHLFFFTNTSFGLDVSADGATSMPKVVIGYKRQEGATFPVIDRHSNLLTDDGFSVLAKYNGGAGSGDNAELQVAQFFATGQAAINLSKQAPGVLANNPEIASAINEFGPSILTSNAVPRSIKVKALIAAFKAMEELEDPSSRRHLAAINAHAAQHFAKYEFDVFQELAAVAPVAPKTLAILHAKNAAVSGADFQKILTYSQALDGSINILSRVQKESGWTEQRAAGAAGVAITPARKKALDALLSDQLDHRFATDKLIYESTVVVATLRYFCARLLPKKSEPK